MCKFPIALPLVIHNVCATISDKQFTYLLPLLVGPIIKWETQPGHITEHELFGVKSKFNLIAALRLGTNSKGKSTILNQLFTTTHLFSSCEEPGANYGKPATLDGSIEFTYLTKETCDSSFWSSIEDNYNNTDATNRVLLLANLHGDALQFIDQLKILKRLASCFVVFIMPDIADDLKIHWTRLKEILEFGKDNIKYFRVDPKVGVKEEKEKIIFTNELINDMTLKKLRNAFSELTRNARFRTVSNLQNFTEKSTSIIMSNKIETLESSELIKFVGKQTCKSIREIMFLQNSLEVTRQSFLQWNNDSGQHLMKLYAEMLILPLTDRKKALLHVDREISKLFYNESEEVRKKIENVRRDIQRTLQLTDQEKSKIEMFKNQLNDLLKRMDDTSLGLEHFYREISKIYVITSMKPSFNQSNTNSETVVELAKSYAELLMDGQSIELLNGDLGEIPSAWLTSICNHVNQKHPNLRVFVISIIGLQSSGKSTLLNALFGCKFAVSVGRCTRGLFLRLVFLEKKLIDELKVDAFLIIDTEGLGAPEKINDQNAEKKDRELATFVMGISDLIIINVMGEYMNSLTEILQIAIVTMARLDEANMSPDILLVQHMNERNVNKLTQATEQFREALNNAIELTKTKGMDIGLRSSTPLVKLFNRMEAGELLKAFRPFKSGASVFSPPSDEYHEDIVSLYKTILELAKGNGIEFSKWQKSINSYWKAVSFEDFAVRFKNIKQFYDFLERVKYISKVKECYEFAFRHHIDANLKTWLKEEAKQFSDESLTSERINEMRRSISNEIKQKLMNVPRSCKINNGKACVSCEAVLNEESKLLNLVKDREFEDDTKRTIANALKHLCESHITAATQMFDSLMMQNGLSNEFMIIIDERVKQAIGKNFNDQESQENSVENIWSQLKVKASAKIKMRPPEELIENEIHIEYPQCTYVHQAFTSDNVDYAHLKNAKAYTKRSKLISSKEVQIEDNELVWFTSRLGTIGKEVFKDSETFQNGMVRQTKRQVDDYISAFEKEFNHKLLEKFAWDIHVYALRFLKKHAITMQGKWDEKNKPLNLLMQKETEYKSIIATRLQFGYELDGEGKIIGDLLLKAIVANAVYAGNKARIDKILKRVDLSNAQNIRLMYFSELLDRKDGEKIAEHFKRPKMQIEKWYNQKINSYYKDVSKTFNSTFKTEYELVCNQIKDITKSTTEDIMKFVNEYLTNADVFYKASIDIESKKSPKGVSLLRDKIFETLKDSIKVNKAKTNIEFKSPTEDSLIMNRLGCTHNCPLCNALCWGQRDHEKDVGETSKHHTSHQPSGLGGTWLHGTNRLSNGLCG